jgi:predicted DNA-binding transcriptional regulator AlpA
MHNTAPQSVAPHKAPKPSTAPVLASSDLADMQRLTMREVRALVGLSETAIRDKMAAGQFPQPEYRDGPRCVRWSAGAVRRWLQATSQQS